MPVRPLLKESVEAEMGILGSILISPSSSLDKCVEKGLTPTHFFTPAHRDIYALLLEVVNEGKSFDLITFTDLLRERGKLETVGGASYVTSLFTFVPTPSNIGYYIEIVLERHLSREVARICEQGAKRAVHDDPQLVISELQSDLLSISHGGSEKKLIQDYAHGAMGQLEEAYLNRGKIPGFGTGLIDLDRQLGGLQPPQLIIVAGETGRGKTALALKVARHNAVDNSVPVGFISLEMSGEELSTRLIASIGKVDLHTFITRGGAESDMHKIAGAVTRLSQSKLHICDDSDIDFLKLRSIGREMKRLSEVEIIVLDYIQLLNASSADDNRERIVAASAASAKQMAKELNVVVIALSQLNDDGKLRESRAIGHHADKVIQIRSGSTEGEIFLDVPKNRQGPRGSVGVVFLPKFADFADRAFDNF